jgi:uncharacterized repeat protein (TIGR01451 family)
MTEDNPHLRRTLVALLLGCALAAGSTASASAAVLKADYGFSGNLTSSVLPAPDLVQVGSCPTPNNFATESVNFVSDQVLDFDAGCGLQLDTSTLIAQGTYSISMLFRFTDVAGFRRLFDSTPGLLDHGLYVSDSRPDYYIGFDNVGPDAPVGANQWGQLVLTRDAATQEVIVYYNGVQEFSFTDFGNEAAIDAAQMPRFFIDDATENSAGAVSRLRLWDAPLTPAEVAALDDNAPTDVSITTTSDTAVAYAGLPLGYTLALSDSGPAASGVVVTDALPAGVDFVSASPGCTELNRVVTCTVGALSGGPTLLHVVVRPTAVNPALANTATVTSTPADPNPANDSSTATTDVQPPSDLAVTMTGDVPDAAVGQPFGYTVAVTNHGPGPAQSVVLADSLSADVDLVSTSAGCILSAGTLTCDLGDLASGATLTRRIVVRPTAPDPQLLNTATVRGTGDVNLDNNFATTLTNVHPPLGLPAVAAMPSPPGSSAPAATPAGSPPTAAPAASNAVGKPVITATTRRGLLRAGLRFRQRFASAGKVRWTLSLPASGSSKAVVLGTATRTLTKSGSVSVTLKLGRAGRRRLAGKRATTLTLRTAFKPAGQPQHTIATAIVRLRG